MLSDNFTPHSHREYQNCRMMIYPDGLNAGYVSARLTVGDKSYTCPVEIADGFLVVRSFTDRTTFALAETADAVAPAESPLCLPMEPPILSTTAMWS